jgi:hypothetical protein
VSDDPNTSKPSPVMTEVVVRAPPVVTPHFCAPVLPFKAYMYVFMEPIYIVPSNPIAGEPTTLIPAL